VSLRKRGRGGRREPPAPTRGGKKIMSEADAWDRAARGGRAKSVTDAQRARDMVRAHGGRGAAERLGVTTRTIRRWTKGQNRPSKGNLGKLRDAHDTREVRAATVPSRRRSRFARTGSGVTMTGRIGPASHEGAYLRIRTISTELPPASMERIMGAFVDAGPDAAHQALAEEMREHYADVGIWQIEQLTEFRFGNPRSTFNEFDE